MNFIRKSLFSYLFIASSILTSHAQSSQEIDNLISFAKAYGYVKYFHPSKQKGLELAKAFTDEHEECAESSPTYKDYDNEMDLRNNWLGRVVFDETAEYKVIESWPFSRTVLYTPSDQDYVDNIKLKADNALIAQKSMAGIDAVRGYNLIYFEGP